MRLYLAIKYHPDHSNRPFIEALASILEQAGFETFCFIRDVEAWGAVQLSPQALMQAAAAAIDASDCVLVETSEKGVGLGIEAGYAYAKGIPVFTLARQGADISTTLQGISTAAITYPSLDELPGLLIPALLRHGLDGQPSRS